MAMTTILVATDLSERSDRALQRGFALAAKWNADVTLASIIDDSLPRTMARDLADQTREHLAAMAKSIAPTRTCRLLVETGDPVVRLVELANHADIDLVVVGRHRKRPFADALRRSTVERLIASASNPVLMVNEPVHGAYAKVLAPVSFSPACRNAVETARRVAPRAEMRMIHAWSAPFEGLTGGPTSDYAHAVERETEDHSRAWSASLTGDFPPVELVHGGVGTTIAQTIRDYAPDLLAIGAHTRSLSFTGLGSITADMVRDPAADLLVTSGRSG